MQTQLTSNKSQVASSSKKATSMADLMKKVAAAKTPFISPHKGDMLMGTITKLTSGEILVDINAKTEAVVLEKERQILNKILSSFKVGDKIQVQVLNPESDFGYPVVSLRRSVGDITWDRLSKLQKAQEAVEVTLDMATKGGFLATTTDGISGFLPNSHTSSLENPQGLIGKKIKVVVLETNRELNKIIFSQKQVMGPADFQKLIKNLKVGQKIDAVVSNVAPFGVFLSIPVDPEGSSRSPSGTIRTRLTERSNGAGSGKLAEGFIHISETSWGNVENISNLFKIGDKITGVVLGFDKDSRRVNLSIKRTVADPLEKKFDEFTIDKKLKATIIKVISTGVILDLGDNVNGFIKKEKIPVKITYKDGQEIDVTVSSVDKKRHRVEVSPVLTAKPIGYR
ncbi:MAG: 30S ribosomal protein S1 [Candidatus Levybacteria bacterium]|nr:30S ribosomal protein S1 [Candidatus Levybacteria bacterium]